MTIKDIQAGNLTSLYFKDIYLCLAKYKLPSSMAAMKQVETQAERYLLLDSLFFRMKIYHEQNPVSFIS